MRRKYKLILIILVSAIITYFIYFSSRDTKINLIALGDGIASGETPYNIDGVSYNDYLQEYFENKRLLKLYNDSYAYKNYQIDDLLEDLKSNITSKNDNLNMQQLIHKANLITISIGEEELTKLAITNDLNKDYLKDYIKEYDHLLYMLKDITEAKIVIIGYYENMYLDKSNVIILNSEISNLAIKYDATFINISDLMLNKDYYLNDKTFYFNYKGHKEITEMIIHSI